MPSPQPTRGQLSAERPAGCGPENRKPRQATWAAPVILREVKAETQSFYEAAVKKAVAHLLTHLDEPLDLAEVARAAALSPFHFHRVFRGMVGETPLAMHRRLRMERAALQLLQGDASVTAIAFDSGYGSHESFTHAFHTHYGVAPSDFRRRSLDRDGSCARSQRFQLAARNGVHFDVTRPNTSQEAIDPETIGLVIASGGVPMDVAIKEMPAFRLGAVRHIGSYQQISEAFQRLDTIVASADLAPNAQTAMLAVYYDDPESTPAEQLRSDAALSLPDDVELPAGLSEVRLQAGTYAMTTHVGPYQGLGDTWARLMGEWLPKSGYRVADGALSYERYRNTPQTAAPHELRTELYLPLSAATSG